MQPYNTTDTAIDRKNSCFILLKRSDFGTVVNLSIALHALPILKSSSVDEILLPRQLKWVY